MAVIVNVPVLPLFAFLFSSASVGSVMLAIVVFAVMPGPVTVAPMSPAVKTPGAERVNTLEAFVSVAVTFRPQLSLPRTEK